MSVLADKSSKLDDSLNKQKEETTNVLQGDGSTKDSTGDMSKSGLAEQSKSETTNQADLETSKERPEGSESTDKTKDYKVETPTPGTSQQTEVGSEPTGKPRHSKVVTPIPGTSQQTEVGSESTRKPKDSKVETPIPGTSQQSSDVASSSTAPAELPFQLQLVYTDTEGVKAMRLLTKTKPVTKDRIQAERGNYIGPVV